jgi:hypothetical protein
MPTVAKRIARLLFLLSIANAASAATGLKFAHIVNYKTAGSFSSFVAIGDLNGDGKPDLVVTDRCQSNNDCEEGIGPGGLSVFLGNGDGTFQTPVSYSSGGISPYSVRIGDLNGDGTPDLVVANYCQGQASCGYLGTNGSISVLLGNGDGTFQAPVTYPSSGVNVQSVAIGDLNGDGYPDLVATNYCLSSTDCTDGILNVFIGNGDGTFRSPVDYASGGLGSSFVAIGDLNGDGKPDLVVANDCLQDGGCSVGGGVSVLLGNGDGTFQAPVLYTFGALQYGANSVAIADVNGDGYPDLAVSDVSDSAVIEVLFGDGSGSFEYGDEYSLNGFWSDSISVADLNGDGNPDLLVSSAARNHTDVGLMSVLLGNNSGTFAAPLSYSSGGREGEDVVAGDLNGDGRPDVVMLSACSNVCGTTGTISVLLNILTYSTSTAVTSSLNPSQIDQAVTFTAKVLSNPSIANGEVVEFYRGKTPLGTGTTIDGAASVTTSFSKAGKYTIKAAYLGDAFHKASSGNVKQVVNP